jgi:hypothetical protein
MTTKNEIQNYNNNNARLPKGTRATTVSKTNNATGNPPPPRKGEMNRPTMRSEERRRKERKTDDDNDEKHKKQALSPNPDKALLNARNGRKATNNDTKQKAS